jgi:uncharacterized protein (TIGR03066 family)
MRVVAALFLFALPSFAAPVPKVKAKTTEQKLVGKWRMVESDSSGKAGQKAYEFYVVFQEMGILELRYEWTEDGRVRSYPGTWKVIDGDKIDYTVMRAGDTKTEVLDIVTLTDIEVAWTDPDKLKEKLEKVKEEDK